MALTLLAGSLLLVALVLMIEGTHFGVWFTGRFELHPAGLAAWHYLRWGIAIVFAMLAVELIYHFGPNLKQRFRDSLPGAIVAVMVWIGLSYLLGSYFRHFDSLDSTYGPLGAAIGLYVWFYLSGLAILLGGEVNVLFSELRDRGNLQSPPTARAQINNRDAAA
jgi:membrane protein